MITILLYPLMEYKSIYYKMHPLMGLYIIFIDTKYSHTFFKFSTYVANECIRSKCGIYANQDRCGPEYMRDNTLYAFEHFGSQCIRQHLTSSNL